MTKKINLKIEDGSVDIIGVEEIKKSWSDFESRQRYIKGADGEYMKDLEGKTIKYYERLWCGRLAKKVQLINDLVVDGDILPDSVVYILTVGSTCDVLEDGTLKVNHNVVLVYDKKENKIYFNKHNTKNSTAYVDFLQGETEADLIEADLPYVTHSRSKKFKDLQSALEDAVDLEADF